MNRLFFLFFIIIAFSFCKKEPKLNIPDEKMIKILVDLQIAEASSMSLGRTVKDSVIGVHYDQVFKIHGVNDSIFFKEFEILRSNPARVEAIYQKVFEEIEQLGSEKVEETKKDQKKK